MKQRYLTWNDFEDFISRAVEQIKKDGKQFTGVYGIPRGGLTIAVTLSHRLDVPLLGAPAKDCLVVDDISDTGITLQHYSDCRYTIITWVAHPGWTKVLPYFFGEEMGDANWIVFPWEENTLTQQEEEHQHAN